MRKTTTLLYSLLALAAIPSMSFAHGGLKYPMERIYTCFTDVTTSGLGNEKANSAACNAALNKEREFGPIASIYNWHGINQAKANDDHKRYVFADRLCSGGAIEDPKTEEDVRMFRFFNDVYLDKDNNIIDWETTDIKPDANGKAKFKYEVMADHKVRYFRFYVTKDGWNQSAPLTWADLEEKPFAEINYNNTYPLLKMGEHELEVTLPKNKTGRHIIYTIWQRPYQLGGAGDDSPEAFYGCSDVNFVSGAQSPTNSLFNNPWK